MSVTTAKTFDALKNRRKKNYANEITGSGNDGNLSLAIKLAYTAPTMSTLPIVVLLAVYMNVYYEKLGASLTYISLFIALARSLDVITDPLMSFITDSCRSKHGRRRPFIMTGCVPYGVFLFLLCSPPSGLSSWNTSNWFGCFYILYYIMNTYSNIPYDALGPELTDNYEDRSRLFFISGLFDGFGTILTVTTPVGLQLMLEWNTIFTSPNCELPAYDMLNNTLPGGPVMLSTDKCSYKDQYAPVGGVQYWESNIAQGNRSLYVPEVCRVEPGLTVPLEFLSYCTCRDACKQAFSFGHERTAFTIVGAGFACWYIITSIICVCCIKERSQLDGGKSLQKPTPLVPSMLNTFNNLPFVMLLPAWACDAVTTGIIASMVSYFVRYVVKPEFQPGCAEGLNPKWYCRSTPVTGLSVTLTLCAAFIFTPAWLVLAKKLGKRKTWLLWSMTMAVTNAFYIFVGEGDYWLCIIISGLNGIPFGAKFLADAILADIIDYDEFLTGQRNEATYTMFKSFLPKICAIPAAAIPLALLNVFGHVPPVNGRVQLQPPAIAVYCQVVTVVIPTLASLVATYFKWKFPLKSKEMVNNISAGVGKHMLGHAAPEPITGVKYKLEKFSESELPMAQLLDSFRGKKIIEELLENPEEASINNIKAAKMKLICAFGSIVCSIACTYVTTNVPIGCYDAAQTMCYTMLEEPKFSFFPVLSIIWFGTSLTAVAFTSLKLSAANRLLIQRPERVVLLKVLSQRKVVAEVHAHMKAGTTVNAGDASSSNNTKVVPFNKKENDNDENQKEPSKEGDSPNDIDDDGEHDKVKTFAEQRADMENEIRLENMEDKKDGDEDGPDSEGKWMI